MPNVTQCISKHQRSKRIDLQLLWYVQLGIDQGGVRDMKPITLVCAVTVHGA